MPPRRTSVPAISPAGNGQAVSGHVVTADEAAVAGLQAAVEGAVQAAETVTFMGAKFRVAEKVGLMPLLKFAHAADQGLQSEDLEGMAAMYAMIRDCIHPGHPCDCGAEADPASGRTRHLDGCQFDAGDWDAFERHAIDKRAESADLFGLITEVMEMVTARPTQPRSGSSPPEPRPSGRSRGSSPPAAAELVSVEDLAR